MTLTKWKLRSLALLTLVVIGGTSGCGGEDAECEVAHDAGEGRFEIVLNPPGEPGEFTQTIPGGSYRSTQSTSKEAGEDAVSTTEYEIDLVRTYNESGNTYEISGTVVFDSSGDESKLTGYSLTITGGVYEDSPFECTK